MKAGPLSRWLCPEFDFDSLAQVDHRPWPLPTRRWAMTQTWTDLLFAHWPVDVAQLAHLVPSAFPIDTFDGQAWISIVPFTMSNVTGRGLPPFPWLSRFPELNVRTYVIRDGKPGIYFFSLDVTRLAAAKAARWGLGLPYYWSAMSSTRTTGGTIDYRSRRLHGSQRLSASYRATGDRVPATIGTVEYFLTERYCLYAVHLGRPYRLEIHHAPWRLRAADASISSNTMTTALGIDLSPVPHLAHVVARMDMVAFRPALLR